MWTTDNNGAFKKHSHHVSCANDGYEGAQVKGCENGSVSSKLLMPTKTLNRKGIMRDTHAHQRIKERASLNLWWNLETKIQLGKCCYWTCLRERWKSTYCLKSASRSIKYLGRVVQRADNAIHWINHYPADSVVCFVNTYPLDSDLSGGYLYPVFEQPGPEHENLSTVTSVTTFLHR